MQQHCIARLQPLLQSGMIAAGALAACNVYLHCLGLHQFFATGMTGQVSHAMINSAAWHTCLCERLNAHQRHMLKSRQTTAFVSNDRREGHLEHLLNGGCVPNGVDAVIGAFHPQELVCDDRPEVGLTALWQLLLQLHQQHTRQLMYDSEAMPAIYGADPKRVCSGVNLLADLTAYMDQFVGKTATGAALARTVDTATDTLLAATLPVSTANRKYTHGLGFDP